MAGGVAGRLEHMGLERSEPDLVVLAHRGIDQRDAAGLAVGRDDAAAMALLEFRDAAGVIGVVMGDEDVGELPAGRLQRGFDRRGLGRIDCRGRARFGVVHEHAIIVREAGKEVDLRGHVIALRNPSARALS